MSADNALHKTSFHEIFKSIKVFWSFHIKAFQIFSQQNLRPLVPNVNWFLLGNCKLFFSCLFFIQVYSNSTYIYRKQLDFHPSLQISFMTLIFKVGLSPSKKVVFTCFNESSLKNDTNAFYLMLEVLFVLEIFRFLSRLFGYKEKHLLDKLSLISKFMTSQSGQKTITRLIVQYVKKKRQPEKVLW